MNEEINSTGRDTIIFEAPYRCKIDAWWRWTIHSKALVKKSNGVVTDNIYCLIIISVKDDSTI